MVNLKIGFFVFILLFPCSIFANTDKENSNSGLIQPGESQFGRNNYIEYSVGNLPIIISVPHGGQLRPNEIPRRKQGQFTWDYNTLELSKLISRKFFDTYGKYPHLIICHLHRNKIDANREIIEATDNNEYAKTAWHEFHGFIDQGKASVTEAYGKGLYVDLHGQGHKIQRVELGYTLTSEQLEMNNESLNNLKHSSSINTLAKETDIEFSSLIRGDNSFGKFLEDLGYDSVPSPKYPNPGDNPYFSGGPNTVRHSSLNGGSISGFSMEVNRDVRASEDNLEPFAEAFVKASMQYLRVNFGIKVETSINSQ